MLMYNTQSQAVKGLAENHIIIFLLLRLIEDILHFLCVSVNNNSERNCNNSSASTHMNNNNED